MSADKYPVLITGTGDNLIVPAPTAPGSFIRVQGIHLTASATTVVTHKSAPSGGVTVCTNYLGTGNSFSAVDPSGVFDLPPQTAYYISCTAGNVGGAIRATVMGAG